MKKIYLSGLMSLFMYWGVSFGQTSDIIVTNAGCPAGNVPAGTVVNLTMQFTCDGIGETANWLTSGASITKNGAPFTSFTFTGLPSLTNGLFANLSFQTDAAGGDTYAVMVSALGTGTNCLNMQVLPKAVCASFLPIDIVYFTVDNDNGKIMLSWSTVSELNNDFVNLERSYDGETFYSIATVLGTGNSDELKKYEVEDHNVLESASSSTAYYRLAQYDLNGQVHYSHIVSVELASQDDLLLQTIAGHSSGIDVTVHSPNETNAVFEIVDLSGKMISSQSVALYKGYQSIEIATNNLGNGIYVMHVFQNGAMASKKFYRR